MIDESVRPNPYPIYEQIRARGPVSTTRIGFITASHDARAGVLRSDDFVTTSVTSGLPKPLAAVERATRTFMFHPVEPPSLLAVDPPVHTRYRTLVSSVFTARAVAAMRADVQAVADRLLDELEADAAAGRPRRHRRALLLAAAGRDHQRHPRGGRVGAPDRAGVRRAGRAESRLRAEVRAVPRRRERPAGVQPLARRAHRRAAPRARRQPDEQADPGQDVGRRRARRPRTARDRRARARGGLRDDRQPARQRRAAADRAPRPARRTCWPTRPAGPTRPTRCCATSHRCR